MGNCTLTFEQMQLRNQKSDNDHRDNDWMTIVWAINGEVKRTDVYQLFNDKGSWILQSGDLIPRFESSVACNDNDLVTATFSVVNLGSTDISEQVDAANKIAEDIAQKVTEVYLDVAQAVLKSGVGVGLGVPQILSELTADAIEALAGTVVKAVGLVFEKILGPILDKLAELYGLLIGKPNCNGDILNDTAVFLPMQPYPEVSIDKPYTSSKVTGCGDPAVTYVFLTLARHIELVPGFASGPPPKVDAVAALKQPLDSWVGTWAEDSTTPTPIIKCIILPSVARSIKRAFKTLDVSIVENVDRRYDAQFKADAFKLSPKPAPQFPFTGNVFGYLRPWHHNFKPGNLTVRFAATPKPIKQGRAAKKGAAKKIAAKKIAQSPVPVFKLTWQNETANMVSFPASALGGIAGGGGAFTETADALFLPDQGVKLTLYEIKHADTHIGYWVRYQRNASVLFTEADVMLVRWAPAL